MAAQAGWYPDPEGDASRLRYWDGTQWTDSYTAAPQDTQASQAADTAQTAAESTQNAQTTQADQAAQAEYVQADYVQDGQVPPAQSTSFNTSNAEYQRFDADQIYPMTNQDRILRLIAFILNIISCVGCAVLIVPLAWMVPMTVRSWGIYKGTRPNTIAFGVCTLIFLDLISGILLLISRKDEV